MPSSVEQFYERIWNAGETGAIYELLSEEVSFRGSLGAHLRGREEFRSYVESVRAALSDYRCEILACVTEGGQSFAQMRFSGRQTGVFRGFLPTGKLVSWLGAALFRFEDGLIAELWVLGDLHGLDAMLSANRDEG